MQNEELSCCLFERPAIIKFQSYSFNTLHLSASYQHDYVQGDADGTLSMARYFCPDAGCDQPIVTNNGTYSGLWSNAPWPSNLIPTGGDIYIPKVLEYAFKPCSSMLNVL